MQKTNALIIGNGHYATGITNISKKKETDKDSGVLLPSVLELKTQGKIDNIAIAARDGEKLKKLNERLKRWKNDYGWTDNIKFYPSSNIKEDNAYIKALDEMPRPLVALIAIPDHLHKEVILECINRGVHFLIVKPSVTKLKELYEIIDKLSNNPVLGMVDYHKVFDEANIIIKSEYENNVYGKINHFYSLMTQRRDMLKIYERWLAVNPELNINHYLGSHYIHLLNYITKAKPLDVRAISQPESGVADLIQTQIRWIDHTGHHFSSHHISGWNDPYESDSMTYQEIHLLCENGHVDSDQRYRGFRKVLSGKGSEVQNPYFFNLTRDPCGSVNLSTKYGFISVKTFVDAVQDCVQNNRSVKDFDSCLPTIRESTKVTAILEAADLSLRNDSCVVKLRSHNGRYLLEAL